MHKKVLLAQYLLLVMLIENSMYHIVIKYLYYGHFVLSVKMLCALLSFSNFLSSPAKTVYN